MDAARSVAVAAPQEGANRPLVPFALCPGGAILAANGSLARVGVGAETEVLVDILGETQVQLVLRPLAHLLVRSTTPFLGDGLQLQFRRRGGAWGERLGFWDLGGRTDLVTRNLPAGDWEWRLRLPTRGDDNRATVWREGSVQVGLGPTATIDVPDR